MRGGGVGVGAQTRLGGGGEYPSANFVENLRYGPISLCAACVAVYGLHRELPDTKERPHAMRL